MSKYDILSMIVVVLVCTNLSCKEPHRQVVVDRVMTSDSLGGVVVSTLALNSSSPALGVMFPIYHHLRDTVTSQIYE